MNERRKLRPFGTIFSTPVTGAVLTKDTESALAVVPSRERTMKLIYSLPNVATIGTLGAVEGKRNVVCKLNGRKRSSSAVVVGSLIPLIWFFLRYAAQLLHATSMLWL